MIYTNFENMFSFAPFYKTLVQIFFICNLLLNKIKIKINIQILLLGDPSAI